MKRFFAMILVLVMTCLPVMGLAEEFVFPEKMTDLFPGGEELFLAEAPVKNPQLLVSEDGEGFFYCESNVENDAVEMSFSAVVEGRYIDLENTEENVYRFPDEENVMAAIEQGTVPELNIGYLADGYSCNWTYYPDDQLWHASVYHFAEVNGYYGTDYFAHWYASDAVSLYCPEHDDLEYAVIYFEEDRTQRTGEYDAAFQLLAHHD